MANHIVYKTTDPVSAPTARGIHWINTVLDKEFFSIGTSTVADWNERGTGGGATADDTAYDATSWNANTDAPTKNVVRDQVETMLTSISAKEVLTNKATNFTVLNDTLYPSVQAVETRLASAIAARSSFIFSGTNLDIGGYESAPSVSLYTVGALASVPIGATTTPQIIEEFATAVLAVSSIQPGAMQVHYQTQKTAGANNYYSYAVI